MGTEKKVLGLAALDCETLADIVADVNDEWSPDQKRLAFDELKERSESGLRAPLDHPV